MTTLEQKVSGYCYSIKNFIPGNGAAGLANGTRRYLGERLHLLSQEQVRRLTEADSCIQDIVKRAADENSWEQDEINDMADYLEQERKLQHAA